MRSSLCQPSVGPCQPWGFSLLCPATNACRPLRIARFAAIGLALLLVGAGPRGSVAACQTETTGVSDGFISLDGGRDLEGWTALETQDPRKFSALPAEEQQRLIAEGREAMKKYWRFEDGEIVNDGEGPYLTTLREFRDFELQLEYRTVAGADSGIYLKATPQIQIWDTTEAGGKWGGDLMAEKGSGGLWNNSKGAPGKDPLVHADRPFGEWNAVRVMQVGARTSVWLNDQLVVDQALMENYWDRKLPLAVTGPIQLQTHGGQIRWRNLRVREIPAEEANSWLANRESGQFQPIFNGTDFTGWAGPVDEYEIVDGALRCKEGKGGTLHTERAYGDFRVRFEFRLPPGGNNGLAIRYPGSGDTAYLGMCELQVLDSEHPKYASLDPRQYHGSAYGMVAAARGYLRPTGQWNFQEVTVRGSKLQVELNGNLILDTDLAGVSAFMNDSPHPGKDRTTGHFGFAGHNDPVEFRKVVLQELEAKQP